MAVYYDKNKKRYVAQVGSDKMGTRERKTFRLKRDADYWVSEQQQKRVSQKIGGYCPYLLISDVLEKFIENLQGRTQKYKNHVKRDIQLIAEYEQFMTLEHITTEKLKHYLGQDHGCSDYTKTKRVKHLKAFCKFVEEQGWYKFDGLKRVSTTDKKAQKKRALNRSEVKKLLTFIKEKSPSGWYPIIFTMLNTGLRSSELIFLEWDDVDLDGMQIRVRPKPHIEINGDPVLCKSKSSVRAISMSSRLRDVLSDLPNKEGFVFPNPDGNHRWNNFYRNFMGILKKAPLNRIEEVTPHVMRHTFISHLLVYGKQDLLTVSRLAGHSSIETTQIYLHLIGGDELRRNAVESLPDYEA